MADSSSCGSACKRGVSYGLNTFVAAAFEYDTPKIVHIKNKKVGVLNRLIQLGIIAFVIGYGLVYEKGYQKTGQVQSVVTTKVKGAYATNDTSYDFTQHCDDPDALMLAPWDVGDLIIPPEQPNSFFIMTNTWITCNQTYGTCPESPSVHDSKCTNDSHCQKGALLEGGNGPMTGKCVNSTVPGDDQKYCEVSAWCPTQNENKTVSKNGPKIDVSDFTVLVKNSIEFPTLNKGLRKRNILDTSNSSFLQTCVHRDNTTLDDLYCPIFSLQQIVDMIPPDSSGNSTDFNELATLGGVVGLDIVWDCDLDYGLNKCHPKYSAKRLDNPDVSISPGFNFRFPKYYNTDGVEERKLYKAYGILFKIEVTGTGGKFDFVTLALKLGSMVALLSIASVVCDVLVLYVLGKRNYYRQRKYLNINDPITDDYQIIDDEDKEEAKPQFTALGKHQA